MMRKLASVVLAILVALSLFWVMHYLILGGDNKRPEVGDYKTVDFVRLKRDERLDTKQRVKPPKPPPPKKPPPPPKMQVQQQQVQQQAPTPFNMPNLNLPTNISGGPFIGGFSPGNTSQGDGGLIPLIRLQPQYPRQAARDGIEGVVVLEIVVNPDGTVRSARVVSAKPRGYFEAAAVNAARKGKFKPKIVDGKAVESVGTYPMEFKLSE